MTTESGRENRAKIGSGALFPARLLGFGLFLAWSAVASILEQSCGVAELSSPLFRLAVGSVLTAAGLMVAAFATHVGERRQPAQSLVIGLSASAVASTLLDLASVATGLFALDAISIVFKSIASAGLFILWNDTISAFSPRVSWVAYAGSAVLAASVYFIADVLGTTAATAILLALPIVGGIALIGSAALPVEPCAETEAVNWHFPWRPLVLVAAFSLARGFVGHYGGNILVGDEFGRLLAGLAILVTLLTAFDRFDIELAAKIAPTFTVAALAFCGVHGGQDLSGVAKMLCCVGYFSFSLYLYMRLGSLCFRYGMRAGWLFGTVQAADILFSLAGSALGNQMRDLGSVDGYAFPDIAAGVVAALLVALCMLLTSGRSADDTWGIRGIRQAEAGELPASSDYLRDYMQTCAEMARHFGLTHREEEVLALLSEGKTFQDIEALLSIAHGTMRAHVQHVYAKLDVHSCEEARDAVNTWKERPRNGRTL